MATSAQLREQIAAGRWDGPLAALYGTAPQELARQQPPQKERTDPSSGQIERTAQK